MLTSDSDEYSLHRRLQTLLGSLRSGDLSGRERAALEQVLIALTGPNNPAALLPEPQGELLRQEELDFLETMKKAKRLGPDLVAALKTAMLRAIISPTIGKRFIVGGYTETFLRGVHGVTRKTSVAKIPVRRRYRLIYAFGGGLTRPVFLDFDHRKDVYKHHNLGTSS